MIPIKSYAAPRLLKIQFIGLLTWAQAALALDQSKLLDLIGTFPNLSTLKFTISYIIVTLVQAFRGTNASFYHLPFTYITIDIPIAYFSLHG